MKPYLAIIVVFFICSCASPHYLLTTDVVSYRDIERVDSIKIKAGEIAELINALPRRESALFILDPVFFDYINAKGNAYHFIDSVKRPVYDGPYYVKLEDIKKFRKHHEYLGAFTSRFFQKRSAEYQTDVPEEL